MRHCMSTSRALGGSDSRYASKEASAPNGARGGTQRVPLPAVAASTCRRDCKIRVALQLRRLAAARIQGVASAPGQAQRPGRHVAPAEAGRLPLLWLLDTVAELRDTAVPLGRAAAQGPRCRPALAGSAELQACFPHRARGRPQQLPGPVRLNLSVPESYLGSYCSTFQAGRAAPAEFAA